jgi:iduronate 2-sulfatase
MIHAMPGSRAKSERLGAALTRRQFAGLLPVTALARSARPRNVLFVVVDDLNTALGCYGQPVRTPWVDRLAARGVTFDRAYCQYPLCQPSRASFLSGLRPETTRVWTLETPTRKYVGDHVFLPEHFRKQGWYTAMVGKVYHTGECCEDPRSWDEEHREFGKNPPQSEIIQLVKADGPRGHTFEWAMLKTPDEKTPDGIVARRAVEIMERMRRMNRPFFLAVGFRRPHAPYAAPAKYFDWYPPDRIALPPAPPKGYRVMPAALNHEPPSKPLTDRQIREFLAAYYACVSFMDAQFGVIMEALDRMGLWDDTVVVFFGDNGYHLGDHGGLWHKNTLFEESARVPLIVWAPGRRGMGSRCARLVELVDLYPTLTELCGLRQPGNLEGTSFVPLLEDPALPWKKGAFTMQGRGKERTEAARDIVFVGRSVRTERWRYTEWDEGRQGIELYDHSSDPGELQNLAGNPRHRAVERELQALLRAGWRAALPVGRG